MNGSIEGFPGATLRSAREALEISAIDVAESLNLPIQVVEGIESGNYEGLPPVTFTRGYIRAYAKLLDLDADELVAQFDATADLTDQSEPVVAKPRRGIVDVSQGDPGRVLSVAVAVVLVAALIILWLVWPEPDDQAPALAGAVEPAAVASAQASDAAAAGEARASVTVESDAALTTPLPSLDTAPAWPAAERPVDDDTVSPQTTAPPAAPSEPSSSLVATAGQTTGADTPPALAAGPAAELADGGGVAMVGSMPPGQVLSFTFSDDCWVEVQDKNGRNIYSDLNRSGQSLEVTGQAPFRILLGYAPGVRLEYNGEPVALTPHTRNNVAQLVLGQ